MDVPLPLLDGSYTRVPGRVRSGSGNDRIGGWGASCPGAPGRVAGRGSPPVALDPASRALRPARGIKTNKIRVSRHAGERIRYPRPRIGVMCVHGGRVPRAARSVRLSASNGSVRDVSARVAAGTWNVAHAKLAGFLRGHSENRVRPRCGSASPGANRLVPVGTGGTGAIMMGGCRRRAAPFPVAFTVIGRGGVDHAREGAYVMP